MSNNFVFERRPSLRSSWNTTHMLVRGRLTDRQIERYARAGWYSAEVREMRRERIAKRKAQQAAREGSFFKLDGRLIYSP